MSNYFKEKELLEKRASVIEEQKELIKAAEDEGRDLSPEEEKQYDAMEEDYNTLTKRINRVREVKKREQDLDENAEERADKITHQKGDDIDPEQIRENDEERKEVFWRVMKQKLLHPDSWRDRMDTEEIRTFQNYQKEVRAQSAGTDSEGGYTVPEGFSGNLYESMKAFGGMRQAADVIQTASGNDLPWPTNDDTSNKGAILSENTQVSEQDTTFNEKVLNAYKYTSKLIRVSRELLQDSAFDLPSWLEGKLAERIGRITNEHFTTGTGSSQPQGVVHAADLGNTTSATDSFTRGEIVDLVHSVDPAYREMPNVAHMFSDNTLKEIKKLSIGSSDARPLWQPSMTVGEPDSVEGFPYVINQDIDDSGTSGNQFWLFGNWDAYKIRDVLDVEILTLRERYADYYQIGYVGFSRHDGELLDSSAIQYMRHTTS